MIIFTGIGYNKKMSAKLTVFPVPVPVKLQTHA